MKRFLCLLLIMCMLLCGCNSVETDDSTRIRIGALTGPTAMGMAQLMKNTEDYEFTLSADPAAFVGALAKGEIDFAAVPANLASVIYNNTNGAVEVLAINTLGVLYIVERGDTVASLADLAGKTLYATGAGAAPEYALRYLLTENGINPDDIAIQWCADTTEALSYISNDENAVAMLPQPFVTTAQMQVEDLRIALDLNAEWEKLNSGSAMVTGVLVARREFVEEHPEKTEKLMKSYAESVDFVQNNLLDASRLIGELDILKTPVAMEALPHCHIVFITGVEMKTAMKGYLQVLYDMNPAAVGGKLPESDFYYGA